MAKQVITALLDDLDGGEADETVSFAMDGYEYEIDLSAKNAAKLRELTAPYQEAGQRLGRVGKQAQLRSYRLNAPPVSNTANREENQRIRLWAAENGYELSDRGRIPQHIVDACRSNTPHPDKIKSEHAKKTVAALAAENTAASQTAPRKRAAAAKKAPAAAFSK